MKLVLILILVFWCRFANGKEVIDENDLYQKFQTVQNILMRKKSLPKFARFWHNDNHHFGKNATKVQRSYSNARCIEDLQWIQNNIKNDKGKWILKSKKLSSKKRFEKISLI